MKNICILFYKEALFNEIIKRNKTAENLMKALLVNVKLEQDTPTMHQQQKEGYVQISNILQKQLKRKGTC